MTSTELSPTGKTLVHCEFVRTPEQTHTGIKLTPYQFKVTADGSDQLGLVGTCQQFADSLGIPLHLNDEQKGAFVIDQFKRAIQAKLELMSVEYKEVPPKRF